MLQTIEIIDDLLQELERVMICSLDLLFTFKGQKFCFVQYGGHSNIKDDNIMK